MNVEMERSKLGQLFYDQWKASLSSCHDSLERDDLRKVTFCNSWDDVQKQISKTADDPSGQTNHQELAMLTPGLLQLRIFIEFFSSQLVPKLDTSIYWGLVHLIIKIAQGEESAIPRVPRMLREVCHKIELLNSHCIDTRSLTPQMREACFESGLTVLSFLSAVVKFMRSDIIYSGSGASIEDEWQPLVQRLRSTLTELDDTLSRIEKLTKLGVKLDDAFRMQSTLGPALPSQPVEEQAKLPCMILPSIRTSRFFDRTDVIEKIEDYFSQVDTTEIFRSLALYGLGGVGKSSVALRYAEGKLRRGELDAMFWVHSEKLNTIRQSFTDIAMRLKLPDARPKDHDENHALVLNWLQNTQCRWLIVYDNAEVMDLICDHWPAANRGQALITTRNRSFAFEPANGGLEIQTWDTETGSRFLLHLLSTDIGAELTENDSKSAYQLSQKLSGHALAISHMAGLIHRRSWSIAEFMEIYDQHPSKMHGVSGNNSINALWDMAFRSLDDHCRAILGVLCFVSPDDVPQALFERESASDLPESLQFCSDHLCFSEAIESLLTLALIRRNKDSRAFSLHRLVQTSFKFFMPPDQKQKSFNDAAILVSLAFPRRDNAEGHMYLVWERCALYLKQVLGLRDCFREEKKANPAFSAVFQYCDLNNACQRYLLELQALTDLEELIEVNRMAVDTLPPDDRVINLRGSLTSHLGQLLLHIGKPAEGVEWLRKSYEIRSKDVPFKPRESAWAAGNLADGLAANNDFPEAIKWHEKAHDHWLEWSNVHTSSPGSWPIGLKNSMAMNLIWAGPSYYNRARETIMQSKYEIDSTEPFDWGFGAQAHFVLATLYRHERAFEHAEAHFMEAQNLWTRGDLLRTGPFNAACMYKMGCVALDQGKLEAAVKHLRDSAAVTVMRKNTMIAEHARCLFKLSEALEQDPRDEVEARKLREEAERLLFIRDPTATEPGRESTYDSLVVTYWR